MKTFQNYDDAKQFARELNTLTNLDAGISKAMEFGRKLYQVSFLPKPENTFGSELNAERVRPGD